VSTLITPQPHMNTEWSDSPHTSDPPFSAPAWLANNHAQTFAGMLPLWAPPRSFRPARVEGLRFPLPQGGALHADAWWHVQSATASVDGRPAAYERRPAVIVVHGVGGSSVSRYVLRAAVSLHRAGWHVLRLNLRGAGTSVADAPELYHAGLTEDLRVAIDQLGARRQVDGVALVGFSLGGHVVLRLAGELGASDPGALRAAVAVSAPVDLVEVTRAIERFRSLPYHLYVLQKLLRQARAFARMHPRRAAYDVNSLWGLRTVRAYDGHVIAPMHGFASAEDYYERASAGPFVSRIEIPTLVVHAEDDPMVPPSTLRAWLSSAPSSVVQAWSRRGGHVGWFGGFSEASWVDTWAMEQTRAFLRAHGSLTSARY
jgi:predicted alpha/beta-fold hydrolase